MTMEKLALKNKYQQLGTFVKPLKLVNGKTKASRKPLTHTHTFACIHYNVQTLPSVLFNLEHFNPPVSIF